MFLFIPTSLILLDVSSMPWSAENELSSSIMLLVTCTCRVWNLQKDDLCACVLSQFSCVQLCDPMDWNLPGFPVHGILQGRILECVAMLSSRGSSWPRDRNCLSYVFCIPTMPPGKPWIRGLGDPWIRRPEAQISYLNVTQTLLCVFHRVRFTWLR